MESSLYLTKILLKCHNSNVVDAEFMKNTGSDKYWIFIYYSNCIFPFTTINNYQLNKTVNQSIIIATIITAPRAILPKHVQY